MSPPGAPIIVGVDGSAYAEAALSWASDQAAATGHPIEVLAAWDWPRSYGWVVPVPSDFDPSADAGRLVDAGEAMVRAAHPDVSCFGSVVQGAPAMALVDASRRASLLVVGSRGHGELAGVLIGSVSQYCVAHSHCPVVVVRGGRPAPPGGDRAAGAGQEAEPAGAGQEAEPAGPGQEAEPAGPV